MRVAVFKFPYPLELHSHPLNAVGEFWSTSNMTTRFTPASARWIPAILSLALALGACRHPAKEPVTLGYERLGWSQPDELPTAEPLNYQFTRETGIDLKPIPVPESTLDQLELSRKLLRSGPGLDVLGIDVIWPGVLSEDLADLRPYLAAELPTLQPELISKYEVNGRLSAVPYQVHVGVLEYRTDLLREYGYKDPPKTWDELETMAARIQAGERAKGNKEFWGYVWQGAATEGLTCDALEWQVAEGGGRIIEDDRTISVNNPATIRAWQRAKRWIGRISPPGVVAYREFDSMNAFDAGRAAFNRVWGGLTEGATNLPGRRPPQVHGRATRPVGKTGYTSIPGGPGGRWGTLGGSGLAVSQHSVHLQEAADLVRFLIHAQIQYSQQFIPANPLTDPEVHDMPSIYYPAHSSEPSAEHQSGIVARPSTVTGANYEQVTLAYIAAVHSVLTGEQTAQKAAAALELQLIQITRFKTGPPKKPN
jgi:trehalose/maltose transport system substrate-binding protein